MKAIRPPAGRPAVVSPGEQRCCHARNRTLVHLAEATLCEPGWSAALAEFFRRSGIVPGPCLVTVCEDCGEVRVFALGWAYRMPPELVPSAHAVAS